MLRRAWAQARRPGDGSKYCRLLDLASTTPSEGHCVSESLRESIGYYQELEFILEILCAA